MPGFFLSVNQSVAIQSRNRRILIQFYPFAFNDLGLTAYWFVARLLASNN
jgi:hypothetical protein